jgi:hypothetical protein
MIISHKYKFIFIKTFKTASTSVEAYFSQYAGSNDILTPITPLVAGHQPQNQAGFFNHMSCKVIKKLINSIIWKSYFMFCIEKNPFAKGLTTKAKTEFRKDQHHYHEVLTLKQQELIKEKFKEEINFYKYEN